MPETERLRGSRQIPLPARDGSVRAYTTVDADLESGLREHVWRLNSDGYAYRFAKADGKRRPIWLHRVVLGLELDDPRQGDHINGERLDNRRSNLRIATLAQNRQNVERARGVSGHRNVYWHEPSKCWRVMLMADGTTYQRYTKDLDEAVAIAAELRRTHAPFAVEDRAA